ncbi:hypothetical protein I7I53_05200 [Histoplasma capsulatum var. duboisii H88]|uniref:Uncharacterized protein n=1 Tax=Ajellomyces capsulatus (strain H88) TaxID=544711 RepID=A0A8A1LWS2_AJEC8|nr:hypothetical protein I7I53_05200 [Histoplasma capsulatum var. duboisii H88]
MPTSVVATTRVDQSEQGPSSSRHDVSKVKLLLPCPALLWTQEARDADCGPNADTCLLSSR